MSLGSQQANVGSISGGDYTGVLHEIYAGDVKPAVRATSPSLQVWKDAGPGDYRIDGEKLVGSTDLDTVNGAVHTTGFLPDHIEADAVEWAITPAQAYRRGAIANAVRARGGKGPGSFGDVLSRLFDQVFESFKRLEIRSAVGGSSGIICVTASRTSNKIIVMKDGYNHVGTHPMMHIEKKNIMAWMDASNSFAVGGSGIVESKVNSTKTVTFVASVENGSGTPTIVAGDVWVMATTTPYTVDYFETEYNIARNGFMDIIDPDEVDTTFLTISEVTYERWAPFREASSTFDHIELTEHWAKLAAQSTDPVTPSSHIAITGPAVYAELARTLEGFQMQQQLGQTFEGGYQAVRVAGMDIVTDPWMLHDVMLTICKENLYRATVDGEADYMDEDGSMFSRIADFDGVEWYIAEYGNQWTDRRNRHAALTSIALPNVDEDSFTTVPNG